MKIYTLKLMVLGVFMAAAAFAAVPPAPEVDAASMAAPLALLGGAVLIVRSKLKR